GSPVDAYLYQYADCFLQGSDSGYGYFDQATGGAYCSKAANNNPSDRIEGFIPVADYYDSSYTWYEAGWGSQNNNGDIYPSVYSAMGGSGLPNRCLCNPASCYAYDNAMAIGWQVTVPGGGSLTRSYFTSFSPVGAVTDTSQP